MTEEVELKLELRPDAADRLEASGLFAGAPVVKLLHAVYFDTPDRALAGAGLSLRVRRDGAVRTQTVKAGAAAAGLFARPEWECVVPDDEPLIDDSTPIRVVLGKRADRVAPIFLVEVERRLWNIVDGDDRIEVALDRGRIVAGDREVPICEVELEHRQGAPAALFAIARRIDAVVPVRLGAMSKSERGYGLLDPFPDAVKADYPALDDGIAAGAAFQRIAGACLRQFRLNEPLLLERRGPAPLHQARVALRRLRAAMTTHKRIVRDHQFVPLLGELRWLTAVLGEARNLDILVERAPPGALRDDLLAARDAAYDGVATALASQRARALMIDLAAWISFGHWAIRADNRRRDASARAFSEKALDRLRRRLKTLGRHVAEIDDDARHDVRKAAKALRYSAEFFAALHRRKRQRRRYRAFIARLGALQDQLGALNDLATAPAVLGRLGLIGAPGAAALLGSVDGRAAMLDEAAAALERVLDVKRFWR